MPAPCYHIPVLLNECMDGLNIQPNGCYIDATFGGGGHSRAIVSHLGEQGRLYSFDQDPDAEKNCWNDPRLHFVRSNFRYLRNWMRYYNEETVDGVLADLGVSSHHFDDKDRGFSYKLGGKLDMRMNSRSGATAADILNTYSEEQLAKLFYLYGELKNGRKLASVIVNKRAEKRIEDTEDFINLIRPLFPREREKKEMAKVFQALRIEVNHEMEALQQMLEAATNVLRPGGRLVILTYHSLEDRMVKNFIKSGNVHGDIKQDFFGRCEVPLKAINRKVTLPSEQEMEENPRSRSAKLRIAEKL